MYSHIFPETWCHIKTHHKTFPATLVYQNISVRWQNTATWQLRCVKSWQKPWQAIPLPTDHHCSASVGSFAAQEINALGAIIYPLIKPSALVRATPSIRKSAEDVWLGAIAPFDKSEETNDCSQVKPSPSSSLSTLNFTKSPSHPRQWQIAGLIKAAATHGYRPEMARQAWWNVPLISFKKTSFVKAGQPGKTGPGQKQTRHLWMNWCHGVLTGSWEVKKVGWLMIHLPSRPPTKFDMKKKLNCLKMYEFFSHPGASTWPLLTISEH